MANYLLLYGLCVLYLKKMTLSDHAFDIKLILSGINIATPAFSGLD